MGKININLAPQVLCRQAHGVNVDYFALGIIVYECMYGHRPFQSTNKNELRDEIMAKDITIKRKNLPPGWSWQSADFVNKCLRRNPKFRLGANGPKEVMEHPWFNDVDWKGIEEKKVETPFKPIYRPREYLHGVEQLSQNSPMKDRKFNKLLLKKQSFQSNFIFIQDIFKEYEYSGGKVDSPLIWNPEPKQLSYI